MNRIESVIEKLKKDGLTVSCAESCTGGLLADAFVAVSGASAVFKGSVVAYDKSAKRSVLGVSKASIKDGVVSEICALEMAKKARKLFKTDIALSSTGYADKSEDANVADGTIFIALSSKGVKIAKKLVLKESRNKNRKKAVRVAVEMLSIFLDAKESDK